MRSPARFAYQSTFPSILQVGALRRFQECAAMTTLDEFSQTAVPLEQYFNETKLGNATGFMWECAGGHYLA
ncbi:hypothetical protein A6U86_29495 [Rhizobium sp. AC27/96]|nr:hypothetical protein A6U86_29495 [Rhizobium sp. AC27/96]